MFKDNDIICFFGDSITANGMWVAEVYQKLREKYRIKCYNCGVGGATADKALKYVYNFCLIHSPAYVVVEFGINDINYNLYSADRADEPGIKEARANAIKVCKENYEKLVSLIADAGAKPIIAVPAPYDDSDTFDSISENLNCQCALDALEPFFLSLAEKYNCKTVNFRAGMQPFLSRGNIMCDDRIHPNESGHHIMAQIFLRDTGVIEFCDFDTPFVFEEWNKLRYDAEQKLLNLNFIEYSALVYDGWDKNKNLQEKKKLAMDMYESFDDKTTFFPQACLEYTENIDHRDKLMGEIVRLTIF